MTDDDDDREERARKAVRAVKRKLPQLFSKAWGRQFVRSHLEYQDVDFLIAAAREGDGDALEILRTHARGARRAGMKVSDNFHAFAWEVFLDGPPKASSGPKSKDTAVRNQTIAILIKIVNEEFGFALHTGRVTAISIVADELNLSESAVVKIREELGVPQ